MSIGEIDLGENRTDLAFKTILEMAILIIESSKDKEEAIKKLKGLSIFEKQYDGQDD